MTPQPIHRLVEDSAWVRIPDAAIGPPSRSWRRSSRAAGFGRASWRGSTADGLGRISLRAPGAGLPEGGGIPSEGVAPREGAPPDAAPREGVPPDAARREGAAPRDGGSPGTGLRPDASRRTEGGGIMSLRGVGFVPLGGTYGSTLTSASRPERAPSECGPLEGV